ncbi:MAG: hypothetical protein PSV24_00675 [Rhodoferax sp.]|nr:hypothetical protein [Rhodoferax sp.]
MEYSYTDIEARIREAQKMRSDALGEILAAGYTKTAQWFSGVIKHKVQQAAAAARSTTAPSF